jgi:hypothetical protein
VQYAGEVSGDNANWENKKPEEYRLFQILSKGGVFLRIVHAQESETGSGIESDAKKNRLVAPHARRSFADEADVELAWHGIFPLANGIRLAEKDQIRDSDLFLSAQIIRSRARNAKRTFFADPYKAAAFKLRLLTLPVLGQSGSCARTNAFRRSAYFAGTAVIQ